ncbi:MAG: bifunctional (p)ppGpp synthetase/guanosine-3',5'-bis(diphosphate) 3'-pyrophosphohydrolase, partial [bacterium]|nr:bifunctional (p)ppGpp synthetase/guanosine-3',5'-bis(diphosphate) 3'-pyrophosphohydrolase [Candidatus Minthenecus merdequi]
TYWRLAHAVDRKIDARKRKTMRDNLLVLSNSADLTWYSQENFLKDMKVAFAMWEELGMGRHVVEAVMTYRAVAEWYWRDREKTEQILDSRLREKEHRALQTKIYDKIVELYDDKTALLVKDLVRVYGYKEEHRTKEAETMRHLIEAVAKDVRVVMIMIVERLVEMRAITIDTDETDRYIIAQETLDLYAPLAHRMGLYAIKTELEDLGLKWTDYVTYKEIAKKLKEKKRERDAYITKFVEPVRKRLQNEGLIFEMKARTKSIYSIWKKMMKQGCDVDGVYDLFAIRIVIDAPRERAKAVCWQAYAVVTDMYVPNTKRLRDWLSTPKSNGYESLHITVMGPEGKWVEVQIRTKEMDEVAEKGVAAHWKYKGGKSDGEKNEEWLRQLRETMEEGVDSESNEAQEQFKMQLYEDDVFVFTPKGDLHQLMRGATVLDFAYDIHSTIGDTAMGARVNGRHVKIDQVLENGDQVEVITAANQKPKPDWLNFVVTAKARKRIRIRLMAMAHGSADMGREMMERKFKNWKVEFDRNDVERIAKKFGYNNVKEFYEAVLSEEVDLMKVRDMILSEKKKK